jgi:hypothetical protein
MEWKSLKEYIPLAVHWSAEGERNGDDVVVPYLTPSHLFFEGGGGYEVDMVREDGMMPSACSGGYGVRYTARTSCDDEDNYDKVYYIYYEGFGPLGRWRYEDKYVAADVIWDADGRVTPTCIYIDDFKYIIKKRGVLHTYPMSTQKADGSGMRYVVVASCKQLLDYNREMWLML